MQASARILGQKVGLTGEEMNRVLFHEGYLQGEPKEYVLTDKGREFAVEKDYHRGTGGYSTYNRYWTTRTFDDSIMDEINFTPELKQKARDEVSERRRLRREERMRSSVDTTSTINASEFFKDVTSPTVSDNSSSSHNLAKDVLIGVGVVAVVAAVGTGIYIGCKHVYPKAKKFINDKISQYKEKRERKEKS